MVSELDPVTLDQLRVLLAVVEAGSFSGAARRLKRVQSAVSHAIATLERQLELTLFDRSTRVPQLTEAGRAVLTAARRVIDEADALRRLADGLRGGLEPLVSLCVDAVFPVTALVDLCREFVAGFPSVELRVHTETLDAVAARVRDGTCQLGVVGPVAHTAGLERTHLTSVRMLPVAAPGHPLASRRGPLPLAAVSAECQIVLSERGELGQAGTPDQGVLSAHTFRVVDLPTKHALLLGGLGWGNLPEHMIREDLAAGRLVRLRIAAWGEEDNVLPLALVHRPSLPLGPATRWLIGRMGELCRRDVEPPPVSPRRPAPRTARRAG